MKTVRLTLLGILLTLTATANAQFTFVKEVDAVELSPSNINLPATASGMMSFRDCDGAEACDAPYVRVQLSPETTFSFDGKKMKFDDFRRTVAGTRMSSSSYALVNYNVKTNIATNVEVRK